MSSRETTDPPAIAQEGGEPGSGTTRRCAKRAYQHLLKELACAEAMIGLAEFSGDFEHFRRSYKNALQAYNLALSYIGDAELGFDQQQEISRRLAIVHKWLQLVGLSLTPE
jgi:hypothetical protein